MGNEVQSPFLKWPGGKSWLVQKYFDVIPQQFNHYFEPFLGGGAVFFALKPKQATISDKNLDLINLYQVMRDFPEILAKKMQFHQKKHSKTYYYEIRKGISNDLIDQAARMLYLNRTCFNGMYRVNKQGMFNVPIGTKNNCIYDINSFILYSHILNNVEIIKADFEESISIARKDDLIFADPPYASSKATDNFIKYNDQLFTWVDQMRLCKCLTEARNRGSIIVLTDVVCDDVKQMYEAEGFWVKKITRFSAISGKKEKRGIVEEFLITSFFVE